MSSLSLLVIIFLADAIVIVISLVMDIRETYSCFHTTQPQIKLHNALSGGDLNLRRRSLFLNWSPPCWGKEGGGGGRCCLEFGTIVLVMVK